MKLCRFLTIDSLWFIPIFFFIAASILPLIPALSYDYHNHQRIIQLLVLTAVFIITTLNTSFFKLQKTVNIDKKSIYACVVILSLGLLSSLLSQEKAFSLMYLIHFLLLVNLLAYVNQYQTKQSSLLFIYFLVASHIALLLICLLNIIFSIADGANINVFIIYSGFLNIRHFNQVQVFVLPLLLMLLKIANIKKVITFMIGFNMYLIYLGQGRGACLAWFVILIFIFVTNKNYKKEVSIAFYASLVALIIHILIELFYQEAFRVIKTDSSGRIDMWIDIITSLKLSHLFIGVGPGIYEFSFPGSAPYSHPHNSIIELLNEWGAIATTAFFFLVFSTAGQAYKHITKHNKDTLTAAIFYAWLSGGGYSLVSGVLVMPVPQTLLFILWGLLLARTAPILLPTANNKIVKTLILIFLLAATGFYNVNAQYLYNTIDPDNGYTYGPRFWSIGKRS